MSRIRYLDIDELNDRLSELEDLESNLQSAQDEYDECGSGDSEELDELRDKLDTAQFNFSEQERDELKKLSDLKDEIGESRGKISEENGPFIHEDDFREYAEALAEDIGAITGKEGWPLTCIDWDHAANELKHDYTSVDWEGVTYYYRA
jgi:DNA repair exonuclease SbcCD ATPase subunit